jgi:hypothetical protein
MRGLVRLSNVLGPPAGITGTRVAVSTMDTGQGLLIAKLRGQGNSSPCPFFEIVLRTICSYEHDRRS